MTVKTICICAVQDPFSSGGAELQAEWLQQELTAWGFEAEIVRVPFVKWRPKTEIITNCLTWRLLDLSESNGRKIDLVICTKFPSYAVRHPNKVVWLTHQLRQAYDLHETEHRFFGDTPEDERIRQQIHEIDRKTLTEARKVFAISGNVAQRLRKYSGLDAEVLYPPLGRERRCSSGPYGDYVLSVGRLDSLKRVDLVISAMAHLKSPARAIIVGEGPDRPRLERLIADLDVGERVSLLGRVDNQRLSELYANSLAVVFTPKDEDYGFVTLEAFTSEKPVLTACDSGGVLEFVEDERNGYVLEPDAREVAGRIDYLYAHKEKARGLGQAGKMKIQGITWDNVIQRLTETK